MPLGLGLGAVPTADGKRLFIIRGQPKAPKGFMMTLENGLEEPCPMDGLTFQAQSMAMTASAMGVGVEKKVLDLAQVEGADLARMIDSSGGVGQSISTYA